LADGHLADGHLADGNLADRHLFLDSWVKGIRKIENGVKGIYLPTDIICLADSRLKGTWLIDI
jgi:predicted phosphohydrolase